MYILRNPLYWLVPMLIQIVSYIKILGKMNKRRGMGIIPVLGELEMSKDLFRKRRSFWRPVIITIALFGTAAYVGISSQYGIVLKLIAFIVYGIFLARLYIRLAKQFGKGKLFAAGMVIMPIIFLPLLAFGKSAYLGKREFKPEKQRSRLSCGFRALGFTVASILELVLLIAACFGFTMISRPIRPVAEYLMEDTIRELASVTDSDEVIGRDVTLGADSEKIIESQRTRDYFFPDHSGDSKVVVMEYIIGSNLEDSRGMASINIAQMKDATAKGDGVEFVLQAGGSQRWFTDGMEDYTVGRYTVSGGKLEMTEELDVLTCMAEPENLTDFIKWTKDNYPADRYMLVLWDHGGGFSGGYGVDELNKRSGENIMSASEIIGAIRDAGVKFDLIGFDACLMQNVEYANALEPYADYYLASEETEPGTGWFYTAGFGKLAADPTLSTEEFGKSMVSGYDQSNRATNKGEPNPETTLSLVDLTLIKPVYSQLTDLYEKATAEIADEPAVFANMSAGRSAAYQFADKEQVDMVSFLDNLKNADYKQQVLTDDELDTISDMAKAAVVYRNTDSAEGVNGIAIDFPYENLGAYSSEYEQLKEVKYNKERKFFDNFCSIMASQQMRQTKKGGFMGLLQYQNFSNAKWYIEGFEDYDTTDLFIDIPVISTEDGYLPELPEKTWNTILDCKVAGYIVADDGLMYIGQEHFANTDADGHPLVSMDGIWANINGHLVCYESDGTMVTDAGTVYKGTVRAKLNGEEDITIHVEWDPVTEDSRDTLTGNVKGYSKDDSDTLPFMEKGLEQFEAGDTIEFVFDFYDEEGNLVKTGTYGDKLRVVTSDRLTVKDEPLASGTEIQYFGVLTDVYQRELMTEEIREQVE